MIFFETDVITLKPEQNKKVQTFVGMHHFRILFFLNSDQLPAAKKDLKWLHHNKCLALLIGQSFSWCEVVRRKK
jgi:hypothetical protein